MFFQALAVFGHDHYIATDGAWCWFADPRAVWADGKVMAGSVTSAGDVVVNVYDPVSKKRETVTLAKEFEKDDHDNPAFVRLADGRWAVFFSKHTGPDMYMATTSRPGSLNDWTKPVAISPNDKSYKGPSGALNAYTYPSPVSLSGEKNRLYLFWRGMNWKPTYSTSDDQGKTWKPGKIVVSPADQSPSNRPYMKVTSDGKSAIHLVFTDGHPRNEPTNSLYYARYEKGGFWTAAGAKIASLSQLPFTPSQADVAYDGKSDGVRCWVWDVAVGADQKPVITYTRLPKEDTHEYRYLRYDGRRWVDRKIVAGGKWFPQTADGKVEPEPHYSGGVVLDHNDPRFVYVSRKVGERFEIERWFTRDHGDHWSHVAITGNSKHDSVRPVVIQGQRPKSGPNVLWMNFTKYKAYQDFTSTIQGADEDFTQPSDPFALSARVWKWVRSNPSTYAETEWMLAPLYQGVLDHAKLANDDQPVQWLRQIGAKSGWKMGPRPSMADDVAIGLAYLRLYEMVQDPSVLAPVKAWNDRFVAMPHTRSLEWKDGVHNEEWAWCDALFMGPPVLAKLSQVTGDQKYVDTMVKLWWKTSDYLFDPQESLYFRDSRYFTPREANGQKVFWSRGNGWVLAGLANVLQALPQGHSARPRLEAQFKAMAARVAQLQTSDGTWHASLLDPASYPSKETSGTSFFVYALAWGINSRLLDAGTYQPVVDKGFSALAACVDPNGRLSFVQPIGQDPRLVHDWDTDTYGVGGFLMAAAQVHKLRHR